MQPEIRGVLLALNRAFYAGFSDDFARTRRAWPLSYQRILPYFQAADNALDLGCGNARLLAFLANHGWRGRYIGVDGSAGLLAEARRTADACAQHAARFVEIDLAAADWPAQISQTLAAETETPAGLPAQTISCLAMLHHIPGQAQRIRFLAQCRSLLAAHGRLIVSTWQFMTSARLQKRVLSWETLGLSPAQVEEDDYLLGWGHGNAGHRYCAFIDRAALEQLATEAGLQVEDLFLADGHEENLNLFAVLSAR